MAYAFDEVTIDSGYGAVVKGGPKASTGMISNPAGLRQANTNRLDRIREWSIDYGLLTVAQLNSLYLFHLARFGMARGFKFIDPIDSTATLESLGATNGVKTVFTLRKAYGTSYVRRIVKPITVALVLTTDIDPGGSPVTTGFSINFTTGTITFTTAPVTGELFWTGTFAIPVIFGSDDFTADVDVVSSDWNGINMIELLPVNLGIT
jgi:uncharacterized protein (TIGR02217 family)